MNNIEYLLKNKILNAFKIIGSKLFTVCVIRRFLMYSLLPMHLNGKFFEKMIF